MITPDSRQYCLEVVRVAMPLVFAVLAFFSTSVLAQSSVFAENLNGPVKISVGPFGYIFVSERGSGNNDGSISMVDQSGRVLPLIAGLPSGIDQNELPSGPTGVVAEGYDGVGCCVLLLLIGEGDAVRYELSGSSEMLTPNPNGVVSPLFSSLLQLSFPSTHGLPTANTQPALLELTDHVLLAEGWRLSFPFGVRNSSSITVRLAADFKDYLPDQWTNVRSANPYAIAVTRERDSRNERMIVADAGLNTLVDPRYVRKSRSRFNFQDYGPPVTFFRLDPDFRAGSSLSRSLSQPTSVRELFRSQFLVTQFGDKNGQGHTGSVRVIRSLNTRNLFGGHGDSDQFPQPLFGGLSSVTDAMGLDSGYYVLEYGGALGAPAAPVGQLLWYKNKLVSEPEILVSDLHGATGMAYSERDNAIYIAELMANRIRKVEL